MNCEDFRTSLQGALDTGTEGFLTPDFLHHTESCSSCKSYYESSLALHRALRQLPRIVPSANLLASLNQIGRADDVPMKLSWGPEFRLGLEMLIPAALPFVAQAFSLVQIQHALEVLMVSLGLGLFGVAVLKPLFLGRPGFRTAPEKT